MNTTLMSLLILLTISAFAEDELSGEIDKLQSGQIESKSVVPEDPSQSAEDVENELNQEFGVPSDKKAEKKEVTPAPEQIPEDIAGPQEEEEAPVVEKTQSPEEQFENDIEVQPEPPKKAEEFKPVEPPPPEIQEDNNEPFVEVPPVQEEPQQPVVEEAPAPQIQEPQQPTEPSYADSVPDDFEERMHRIYEQFYTEATSDSAWTQIAGEKINETYTIQPGDTLWDISVTFFGNGHYWPKVWQMNDEITNPHMISAGYVLKFVPGQIDKAPQLNIAGQEALPTTPTPEGQTAGTTELNQSVAQNVVEPDPVPVIPPPSKKYPPVLKNLPASLPYIKAAASHGFDKDGFDIQNKPPKIQDPKVYLTSYLSEEEPTQVGKIIEMNDEDDETATLYETVFVQMTNGATIGEKLMIYSLGDKIYDTNGSKMGYPVIQEGELQVQELVNPKKDVYKAIVVRSIGPAKIGSYVSRSELAVGNLTTQKVSSPINAEIIGGLFDNERKYLGYQDVVYLNKGSKEGVKEGQVFTVLKSVRDRKSSSLVDDLKEQIAKIKILKTTGERSTAIVLQSSQYIRSGDFIGVQAKLPEPTVIKEAQPSDDEAVDDNSDNDSDFDQDSDLEEPELQ